MGSETVRMRGDGLDLAASVFGPADGMPVLFFHGGGQSRRAWEAAARNLGASGYRALSFDLRGHGDSDWADDGDYLLAAFGRDVACLVDQFPRSVALVGASRGGQAALVGASLRPDMAALVLLADVVPEIDDSRVDHFRGFFAASLSGFATLDEAADALASHLGRERLKSAGALAHAMRMQDGRYYWHWDPRTVAPEFLNPPSEQQTMIAAAQAMHTALVLVRAGRSFLVSDDAVARFKALAPQLQVEVIEDAHHMLTGDQNDAFAQCLRDRLAAISNQA